MSVILTLQNPAGAVDHPSETQFKDWINTTLALASTDKGDTEVTIRLVDLMESAELNQTYRHKSGPTNVLSFHYDEIATDEETMHLGDLVICPELVLEEAVHQEKPCEAHWAHLTVHGILHLLGHDHEVEDEANAMESIEIKILAQLGYANPYDE